MSKDSSSIHPSIRCDLNWKKKVETGREEMGYQASSPVALKWEIKKIGNALIIVHGERVVRLVERRLQTEERLRDCRHGGNVDARPNGHRQLLILVHSLQKERVLVVIFDRERANHLLAVSGPVRLDRWSPASAARGAGKAIERLRRRRHRRGRSLIFWAQEHFDFSSLTLHVHVETFTWMRYLKYLKGPT